MDNNLILFPGGKSKTMPNSSRGKGNESEATKLLKQFIDISVIRDKNKQREAYTELREAIYDYLPDYKV